MLGSVSPFSVASFYYSQRRHAYLTDVPSTLDSAGADPESTRVATLSDIFETRCRFHCFLPLHHDYIASDSSGIRILPTSKLPRWNAVTPRRTPRKARSFIRSHSFFLYPCLCPCLCHFPSFPFHHPPSSHPHLPFLPPPSSPSILLFISFLFLRAYLRHGFLVPCSFLSWFIVIVSA
jgi:hypothetical protein